MPAFVFLLNRAVVSSSRGRWKNFPQMFVSIARSCWPRPSRRRLGLHRLDAPRQLGEEATHLLGVVPLAYGAELHAGDGLRAELHLAIV